MRLELCGTRGDNVALFTNSTLNVLRQSIHFVLSIRHIHDYYTVAFVKTVQNRGEALSNGASYSIHFTNEEC